MYLTCIAVSSQPLRRGAGRGAWPRSRLLLALGLGLALGAGTLSACGGGSSRADLGDTGGSDGGADAASDADAAPGADAEPDAASDADTDADPDAAPPADMTGAAPPAQLMLEGSATGTDPEDDAVVDCNFFGTVEMLEPGPDGFAAFASGEVFRRITREGLPLEFQAFVAGPATLAIDGEGNVELRWVGDQSAKGVKPFWQELEAITGTEVEPYSYEGTWRCAPIEPDPEGDFQDAQISIDGEWQLAPPP
jgi:hypothetical protein